MEPISTGRLEGKVAIVTGASRGIGKALAIGLAQEGAKVVAAARTEVEEHLPGTILKTAEEIRALGGTVLPLRCDVTSQADIDAMVARTLEEFGQIDVMVNNAGIGSHASILEVSVETWDQVFATDIRGRFLCCRAVLPSMIRRRQGSIINVSSGAAHVRDMWHGPYAAAKAALERFSLCLAEEIRGYNIAANALEPGGIVSPGIAEGLRAQGREWTLAGRRPPESVVPAVVFLSYQDARSFTGQVVKAQEFY